MVGKRRSRDETLWWEREGKVMIDCGGKEKVKR